MEEENRKKNFFFQLNSIFLELNWKRKLCSSLIDFLSEIVCVSVESYKFCDLNLSRDKWKRICRGFCSLENFHI